MLPNVQKKQLWDQILNISPNPPKNGVILCRPRSTKHISQIIGRSHISRFDCYTKLSKNFRLLDKLLHKKSVQIFFFEKWSAKILDTFIKDLFCSYRTKSYRRNFGFALFLESIQTDAKNGKSLTHNEWSKENEGINIKNIIK